MKRIVIRWMGLLGYLCLSACSVAPTSIIPHATSVQASLAKPMPQNGSIYQAATYRSALGDYHARAVGDVMNVIINEAASANKSNQVSDKYASSVQADLKSFMGINLHNIGVSETASINSSDQANGSAKFQFSGSVAVTVLEVLPNGNLLVSGEKQIGMDKGTEFIRISGVINPIKILHGNVIPSTELADARVEYRTNSQLDPAELIKSIGRIFSAILLL